MSVPASHNTFPDGAERASDLGLPATEILASYESILDAPYIERYQKNAATPNFVEALWPAKPGVPGLMLGVCSPSTEDSEVEHSDEGLSLSYANLDYMAGYLTTGGLQGPAAGLGFRAGRLTVGDDELIAIRHPHPTDLNESLMQAGETRPRFVLFDGDEFTALQQAEAQAQGGVLTSNSDRMRFHDTAFHGLVRGFLATEVEDAFTDKADFELAHDMDVDAYTVDGRDRGNPLVAIADGWINPEAFPAFANAYNDFKQGIDYRYSLEDLGEKLAFWVMTPRFYPEDKGKELARLTLEHMDRLAELVISS